MTESWLVVRRLGCLWAVPGGALHISRADEGLSIRFGGTTLVADEVLELLQRMRISPVGRTLAGLLPPGCTGLAVCARGPMVVVDPSAPPEALCAPGGANGGAGCLDPSQGVARPMGERGALQ